MTAAPDQQWWTAEELAQARLPDMPASRKGVEKLCVRNGWRGDPERARRRTGRGGGWEYSWELLPHRARKALLERAGTRQIMAKPDRGALWAAFEKLPEATRAKAADRLRTVQAVEALVASGSSKLIAVGDVARQIGASDRTLWNWFDMIEGVAPQDRLPHLAPRHRLAVRKPVQTPDYGAFMAVLKGDWLRLEAPPFRSSYRRAVAICEAEGHAIPPETTARRHLNAEVPRTTRVFAREGVAGLERCFPPQIRDRSSLAALDLVNADCHKIDVFVAWPDGRITRPQIVAFQDVYSGKVLSWRVDHDPNKVMVMAAFGEMVETWGLPRACLFDNGREFANKWMTGGAPTRFRFKVLDTDPLGVLPLLDVQVHWARPGHGQAKPIERAFRDLASDIAKDPRFAGAYVGNRPDAKPENYQSHAVPVEEFLAVLDEGIRAHNARPGRLSHTALGRSFDATFAASYETAPIRKATEEQRRLWLMGQAVVTCHRQNAQVTVHGNAYHADWMAEFAGQRLVARFDPENLHAGVYLYDTEGVFHGYAACREKTGFLDMVEARQSARDRRARLKAERDRLAALRPVSTADVAARLGAIAPADTASPEAKVVNPEFGKRPHRSPLVAPAPYRAPERSAEIEDYHARFLKRQAEAGRRAPDQDESREDRFRRYLAIKAREEAGEEIGAAEARFALSYPESAEYRQLKRLIDLNGLEALG